MTDPSNLPRRRAMRLPGWDYRRPAYYFVTICTHGRLHLFDDPSLHEITALTWRLIPSRPHARDWLLDEWTVMPNHLHGVLLRLTPLDDTPSDVATDPTAPDDSPALLAGLPFDMRFAGDWGAVDDPAAGQQPARHGGKTPGSLGSVVGTFKTEATRRINAARRSRGSQVWQRGYYERIVRNDRELERIRIYIRENPARWAADRDNLDDLLARMTYRRG